MGVVTTREPALHYQSACNGVLIHAIRIHMHDVIKNNSETARNHTVHDSEWPLYSLERTAVVMISHDHELI